MDLKLSPEDIERLVKETILKSSFGKAVSDSVSRVLTGYNSPVEEAVKQAIRSAIVVILDSPEYKPQIEQACRDVIAKKIKPELITKFADATLDKIYRAVDGY